MGAAHTGGQATWGWCTREQSSGESSQSTDVLEVLPTPAIHTAPPHELRKALTLRYEEVRQGAGA